MESIDGEYWTKCINKMKKEAVYYLIQDGVLEGDTATEALAKVDDTVQFSTDIPVRLILLAFTVFWLYF